MPAPEVHGLVRIDHVTRRLVELALEEDLGHGDLSSAVVPAKTRARAVVRVKSDTVLAGVDVFNEVFRQLDPEVSVVFLLEEGSVVRRGMIVAEVRGPARSILGGERTALNFLQRLCGIANGARRASEAVRGTRARVVDTRKTTPGLRALEKHAVRAGGAHNHRFGLFDGVMIKDNHIHAAGGVRQAIEAARAQVHHLLRIECEVTTLEELDEALAACADVILLDNMDTATLSEAVHRIGGRALSEVSGGVTFDRLREIAALGVDFISMGALTHSVTAADISLDFETDPQEVGTGGLKPKPGEAPG